MSFREVEGHVDFCFESLNAGGLISAKECKDRTKAGVKGHLPTWRNGTWAWKHNVWAKGSLKFNKPSKAGIVDCLLNFTKT